MFKDIKVGIKMLKYGLNAKTQFGIGAAFLLLGIGITFANNSSYEDFALRSLGGCYLMIAFAYPAQILIVTTVSKMLQASPYKKKLQVTIPALLFFVGNVIAYSIYILIMMITRRGIGRTGMGVQILFTGLMAFALQVIGILAYKAYILGMVVMIISVLSIISVISRPGEFVGLITKFADMEGIAILLGYATIIVGLFISLLVGKLLYRLELSGMSYRSALQRASR